MTRRHLILITALALSYAGPALASGDSCDPGWSLDFSTKPRCDNVSALLPGNDTRANILLLLSDRHGEQASPDPADQPLLDWPAFRDRFVPGSGGLLPSDYADGESSRCLSNAAGDKAFAAAVNAAAGVPESERRTLIEARTGLKPACAAKAGQSAPTPTMAGIVSPTGRAFAAYLDAAAAFYEGRFDEAAKGFSALASASDPWLSDTAGYMLARNAVNRMQANAFEQYGTFKGPDSVDKGQAAEAERLLDAYVTGHPKGRYVASAQGLQRRVDWLAGWNDKLVTRYVALLSRPPAERGLSDAALAEEIDNKVQPALNPDVTRDPTLLAVLDLMALRKDPGTPRRSRPDLVSQREAFANDPDLYGFLEAAYAFYGDGDPKAVLRIIPDAAKRRGGNHLWFSRQFLRGLALEATGDRNARGFWKELIPAASRPLDRSAAELALALNDEKRGDVEDALVGSVPVTTPSTRAMLLIHDAGPDLLRSRATDPAATERERQVSLFTLLRKEITHGAYVDFLRDVTRVPADATKDGMVAVDPLGEGTIPLGLFPRGETAGEIGCPRLTDTVPRLARDPVATRSRLCLGEWIRLNNLDPMSFPNKPAKGSLGSGPSSFPGRELTRGDIYAAILADPDASSDDRAYALYRSVKCYEPSANNACGGKGADKTERKRWYDTLKRDYPGSRWARELRFWW